MQQHSLLVASFDSEETILGAAIAAKEAGMPAHDAYTPFPIHGMDDALNLEASRIPWLCFIFGATGLCLTLSFQFWVSLFDWPMNIGGKSYAASPALIPVAFEMTILFAGLGTVASFLRMRNLHPGKKPALPGLHATNDRFLLVFREGPHGAGKETMRRFLEKQGALSVQEVHGLGGRK